MTAPNAANPNAVSAWPEEVKLPAPRPANTFSTPGSASPLPALTDAMAYGTGMRLCHGKAVKPFTPSLNQTASCKLGCANRPAGSAAMFTCAAFPKITVKRPFVTPTVTGAVGSDPRTLVPSLLQNVVVTAPLLATNANWNSPMPV